MMAAAVAPEAVTTARPASAQADVKEASMASCRGTMLR